MRSQSLALLAVLVSLSVVKYTKITPATKNAVPTTVNASSCKISDVERAVNQANPGDTVGIPAGTCIWTRTLTVSSAVNILGPADGTAVIVDNVDRSRCSDHPALFINISANLPWRLANLTIQGGADDHGGCSESIKVLTNSHAFRMDHLIFNNMTTTGIKIDGDAWGLVDHATFNGNHRRGVLIHHTSWGQVGGWGDNSWAQPDTMGTNQAVFVEDSTFNIEHSSGVGSVACEYGGRCVARYNKLPFLGTHGTDSNERQRSLRQFEVYDNVINDNGSTVSQAMQLRGGTALFFNNTIEPTARGSYKGILPLEIYREVDAWTPWGPVSNANKGGCDGTGPFDNNDGVVYDSGTYNGTNGTRDTLTDTTKHWSTNQWIGYSVRNDATHPWGASIESNTSTTITTYGASMGPGHPWNSGDKYQILKVYPCLDQPGRGVGRYISGGTFRQPPSDSGWLQEAADPIYAWNNTLNGTLVSTIGQYYTHVQANRDYYDWTANFDGTTGVGEGLLSARPLTCTPLVAYWATDTTTLYQCSAKNTWTVYYKPYTYPHPLQGTLPPSSPTNIKVTGVH
jgi:hypothetical protein